MTDTNEYLWDPNATPDSETVRFEEALRDFRFQPESLSLPRHRRTQGFAWRAAVISAAAVLALMAGTWSVWELSKPSPWSVATVQGTPDVRAGVQVTDRLGPGSVVTTDPVSSARIAVGRVGVVDVAPGSRLTVLRQDGEEHRLALSYGTVHANIWARPRFFIVETPAVAAVDLGCVYTLTVDSTGNGMLGVSFGEVQLEGSRGITLVAAGTVARFYGNRLGIPFPINASPGFKDAVASIDRGGGLSQVLPILLSDATEQGTITLWHLFERADSVTRTVIYDRIVALVPAPPAVIKAAALALDPQTLSLWRDALRPKWSSESGSFVRRLLVRMGLQKPLMQIAIQQQTP